MELKCTKLFSKSKNLNRKYCSYQTGLVICKDRRFRSGVATKFTSSILRVYRRASITIRSRRCSCNRRLSCRSWRSLKGLRGLSNSVRGSSRVKTQEISLGVNEKMKLNDWNWSLLSWKQTPSLRTTFWLRKSKIGFKSRKARTPLKVG